MIPAISQSGESAYINVETARAEEHDLIAPPKKRRKIDANMELKRLEEDLIAAAESGNDLNLAFFLQSGGDINAGIWGMHSSNERC